MWQARGIEIVQGYGLTEAAPNVLCLPPEDAMRKMGSAGKPYPYVEVRLGARTELQVRGPNVFPGYWRNPEATAAALRDGWLRTGDVAERDDEGYYRIRGRLKDMYISGGENVYPAEVESVLHEHRGRRGRGRRRRARRALGRGRRRVRRREGDTERGRAARALPRPARAVQGAEAFRSSWSSPLSAMGKVLKDELRARRAVGDRVTDLAGATGVEGGSSRAAAPRRGAGCSRRRSASSPSSATTTRRS